ncbi:MAG TPA: hypothetical protein VHO70_08225 [Chitinispirillaceae bacterium]|nr:hypothetical protein [Chitinispirillaceae bacterium]
MNELLNKPYILLLLSATALIVTFTLLSKVSDSLIQTASISTKHSSKIENESFKIIDKALKETVNQQFFNYTGDFENPFQSGSSDRTELSSSGRVTKVAKIERIPLTLKGILTNERPLAILEDNNGHTFIRAVGDSVENQRIIAISGSSVTILDGKSKYSIAVKEE